VQLLLANSCSVVEVVFLMHKQAILRAAFPKARKVARTLGVSHGRASKLVKLMDSIAANGQVYQLTTKRKARVAKKEK
jgi:hypothetical protein